jgi:hypothetical protein
LRKAEFEVDYRRWRDSVLLVYVDIIGSMVEVKETSCRVVPVYDDDVRLIPSAP